MVRRVGTTRSREADDDPSARSASEEAFQEVIHLQVPLQIPCYDLVPLAEPKFERPK